MGVNNLMKISLTASAFLLFVVLSSCSVSNNGTNAHVSNENKSEVNDNCKIISSETAVLIAQGYLYTSYELRGREVRVETETELWKDKGEMWKITFQRTKNLDAFGGDPIVWIFKSNGEIFSVKHSK